MRILDFLPFRPVRMDSKKSVVFRCACHVLDWNFISAVLVVEYLELLKPVGCKCSFFLCISKPFTSDVIWPAMTLSSSTMICTSTAFSSRDPRLNSFVMNAIRLDSVNGPSYNRINHYIYIPSKRYTAYSKCGVDQISSPTTQFHHFHPSQTHKYRYTYDSKLQIWICHREWSSCPGFLDI